MEPLTIWIYNGDVISRDFVFDTTYKGRNGTSDFGTATLAASSGRALTEVLGFSQRKPARFSSR